MFITSAESEICFTICSIHASTNFYRLKTSLEFNPTSNHAGFVPKVMLFSISGINNEDEHLSENEDEIKEEEAKENEEVEKSEPKAKV